MPVETFDTLDAVPEEMRDAAIETKAGKFIVARDPDTSGLTSALEKERKARRDAEKVAKERDARLAELELEAKGTAAGLTSEKLKEIRAQVAAEFEPYKSKAEALAAENRALKLNDRVKAMLAKADFVDVDAAWKLFGDEFDLTDDGQPIVKAEPGKAIDKHIADLAAAKPYLVKGTQASGGGAGGNRGTGAPAKGDDVFTWTSEQRAQFIQTNGLAAYQDKLDAAQVARAVAAKKAA